MSKPCRHSDGTFAVPSFEAIYAEVKRLDQLRTADQVATSTALSAAKEAVAAALAASDKATSKAEENQRRVNEGQNEFRGQLKDQAATMMPRAESELIFKELRTSLQAIQTKVDIGPPSLATLQTESDRRGGRDTGTGDTWKVIVAIVGVVFGLIGAVAASAAVASALT